MKMGRKVVFAVGLCTASLFATPVHGRTVALNLGGASAPQAPAASATDGETVKVLARGVGVDKTTALKDAYRDAVERAVGLYVDAESIVANDELVKDEVLTHSNAYVTHYDEIGSENTLDGGLVQVRIVATVKKLALTSKLKDVMPAQVVNLNSTALKDAHAQMVSAEKRSEDASALLTSALADLDPVKSLIVADVRAETQKLMTGNQVRVNGAPLPSDKAMLRYLFELRLDREKYFKEFVPNLKKTLDQISLEKPKEVRLVELVCASSSSYSYASELEGFKSGNFRRSPLFNNHSWMSYVQPQQPVAMDGIHVYSALLNGKNHVWKFDDDRWAPKTGGSFSWCNVSLSHEGFDSSFRKDKVVFVLITSMNKDCSMGKATVYALDRACVDVMDRWISSCVFIGGDSSGKGAGPSPFTRHGGPSFKQNRKVAYSIVLQDSEGEELQAYPWEVEYNWLVNVKLAEIPAAGMVYCTPFVGCFGESFIEWKDLVLDKDILSKVSSLKIELAE